ncbi:MAG: PorT family protein [Prevotellaceae bacterium]|nr:PorT family protein [Prevotellaceae bacterium]
MKKIILACVAAIFSLSFVNAQEEVAVEEVEITSTREVQPEVQPVAIIPQEEPELQADPALVMDSVITRPFMLGAAAGVNMTSYSGDVDASFGIGFQFGISCDAPIGVNLFKGYLSINPELIFAYKTVGLDANVLGYESTDRFWSMNVPVHAKWNKSMGPGFLWVAAGPMLNVYLGGTNKSKLQVEVIDNKGELKKEHLEMLLFQADPDDLANDYIRDNALYNILGFSLNFKVGYDFKSGLSVSAGYQLGLSNMTNKAVYNDYNKQIDEINKELMVNLNGRVETGELTTQEKDALYKEEAMSNLAAPVIRNGSIFLTVGYVF